MKKILLALILLVAIGSVLGIQVSLNAPDNFYSPADGFVNVTVNTTGLVNVSKVWLDVYNISDGTCISPSNDTMILMTNDTANFWNASCNIASHINTVAPTFNTLHVIVENTTFNILNTTTVVIYKQDLGVPAMPAGCSRFGSSTTNLSQQTNFNSIPLLLYIEINKTCLGIPASSGEYESAALLNFTSINLTDLTQAQHLAGLASAMNVAINAPNSFGDSIVYINTTYLSSLSVNTTIKLYDLPFITIPSVVGDVAGGLNSTSVSWTQEPGKGNITFKVFHFSEYNVTDNTVPAITIHTPSANNISEVNTTVVNVTLNGTGTQISAATFLVNNVQVANYTNATINSANCAARSPSSELFDCLFAVADQAEGTYNLSITTFDFGGSSPGNTVTASVLYIIDRLAPVVSINLPVSNSRYNTGTLTINVTATDANLKNTTVIIYNSTSGPVNGTMSTTNGNFQVLLAVLADGVYSINATTFDTAGNSTMTFVTNITIDNTVPTITLQSPIDRQNFTTSLVPINFSAADASGIDKMWYDNGTVNISFTVNQTLTLAEGTHTFVFYANDTFGNIGGTAITFVVDTTGPILVVTNPSSTPKYLAAAATSYVMNGSAIDASSSVKNITMFIFGAFNGTAVYNTTAFNWTFSVQPLAVGTYNVSVIAYDVNNNPSALQNFILIIDNTVPSLAINIPTDGQALADSTLVLDFNTSDAASNLQNCWYKVTGPKNISNTSIACVPGENTATIHLVNGSGYNITVYANDSSGNTNRSFALFSINDATSPSITYTPNSEVNNTFSNRTYTYIEINTSEIAQVCQLSFNGTDPITMNTTNNITWYFNETGLANSSVKAYTYFVFCNDTAYNGGLSLIRKYTVDFTAPVMTENTASSFSSDTTSVTLDVSTDEAATCRYSSSDVVYDSMPSANTMSGAGTSHTSSVTVTSGTSYTFYARCIDLAGNKDTSSRIISFSVSSGSGGNGGGDSSGGGSSSGGVTSSDPSQSFSYPTFSVGDKSIDITDGDIALEKVTFTNTLAATGVRFTITQASSPDHTFAGGSAYKYITIDDTNVVDTAVSGIKLQYSVSKSWLASNNLNRTDVALYRWNNGWTKLVTRQISEDPVYVTYESDSPGFSLYAISGIKAVPEVVTPQQTPAENVTAPVTAPAENLTGNETANPKPNENAPSSKAWLWVVAVLIALAIVLIVMNLRRKKRKF